ncbi:MAG: UTP--glucose-1-phosphate uridylyltransferase [Candidatus Saccharimonadales bacterium]
MKQPTKAIIAAAGLGTRFLPQTKAMPKEMLPIVDKPVIQIIVEQLVAAGVETVIIVTGYSKRAIEDHFDRSDEFENELRAKGKDEQANQIKAVAEMANFVYVRQKGTPKGNARPVLNARHLIDDDEPFFVIFADDFFRGDVPYPKQLLEAYQKTGSSVISFVEVEPEDTKRLGIAVVNGKVDDSTYKITGFVEKPGPEKAPSSFASVGSYLLTPDIWPILEQEKVGYGGELVLGDSIGELAQKTDVYGRVIEGVWHDAGDKGRYLQAIVDYALINPKLGPKFRAYLEKRLAQED